MFLVLCTEGDLGFGKVCCPRLLCFIVGLREAAAVTSAVVGGCRAVNCEILVDSVDVAVAAEIWPSTALTEVLSSGSASPLGYPRVVTPTWRESADPVIPRPPTEEWLPSGSSWGWVDTGPATSFDIDPDSLVDTPCSPTEITISEVVVATRAESPCSISSGSTSLRALALVL